MDYVQLAALVASVAGPAALWYKIGRVEATVTGNEKTHKVELNGVKALVAGVVQDREACQQREGEVTRDHENRLRELEKG